MTKTNIDIFTECKPLRAADGELHANMSSINNKIAVVHDGIFEDRDKCLIGHAPNCNRLLR